MGIMARFVTIPVNFFTFPLTIRYLGNEGYALMAMITSVVGWLQMSNMGLGLGLQNALIEESAKDNSLGQTRLISTAAATLLAIAFFLTIGAMGLWPFINLQVIFPQTSHRFTSELPHGVILVFACFLGNFVLNFLPAIYAARQELHIGHVQTIITSAGILVATLIAIRLDGGLTGMIFASVGVAATVQAGFAVWMLCVRGVGELRPKLKCIDRSALQQMMSTGVPFFILQITNIIFFQIDAFLIGHLASTDSFTPFAVAQKVFMLASSILVVMSSSLWAAIGNAKAVGDYHWIRRNYERTVRLFLLIYLLFVTTMALTGKQLLTIWVGSASVPERGLLLVVALYFFAREWSALNSMILNGLNIVRSQVPVTVLAAALSLLLSFWFLKRYGVIGLPVAGLVATLATSAWYFPRLVVKELTAMSRN